MCEHKYYCGKHLKLSLKEKIRLQFQRTEEEFLHMPSSQLRQNLVSLHRINICENKGEGSRNKKLLNKILNLLKS